MSTRTIHRDETQADTQVKKPRLFQVVLINDDFTPMEFVVYIIQRFFNKSIEDAHLLMLDVHKKGAAQCGVFTREVAETKAMNVIQMARQNEHPLQCRVEPVSEDSNADT